MSHPQSVMEFCRSLQLGCHSFYHGIHVSVPESLTSLTRTNTKNKKHSSISCCRIRSYPKSHAECGISEQTIRKTKQKPQTNQQTNMKPKTAQEIVQELSIRVDCDYMIVCHSNRMALDGDVTAAKQLSRTHRRPWLNFDLNFCSPSQYWRLVQVDEEAKSYQPCFLIGLMLFTAEPLCLDGNCARHVPQVATKYPTPFLWGVRAAPKNHQWLLEPVTDRGPNIFVLINRANGKCLDGNVSVVTHADENHKAPFLANYRSLTHIAPSQCWELIPVPKHLMSLSYAPTISSSTGDIVTETILNHTQQQQQPFVPFLSNGIYQITCFVIPPSSLLPPNGLEEERHQQEQEAQEQQTGDEHETNIITTRTNCLMSQPRGQCLVHRDHCTIELTSYHGGASSSPSSQLTTPHMGGSGDVNGGGGGGVMMDRNDTLWRITHVGHNNQYMIEKYTGYSTNNRLFVTYEPDTRLSLKCSSGIGATERSMIWQLFQTDLDTSSAYDPRAFYVVNVHNGQCWDADDCKVGLTGHVLRPPSLSPFDYRRRKSSHVWLFDKQQ